MSVSRLATALLTALALSSLVLTTGCGSDGGKPQSIANEEKVNQIVEMRKLYDKAGGNWESLSAEDKAAYTKYAGDDSKAQAMWKKMGTPVGANPG